MAARTQKQRDQWRRRTLLGDLTGLSEWVNSVSLRIMENPDLTWSERQPLLFAAGKLCEVLDSIAEQHRWKPKV